MIYQFKNNYRVPGATPQEVGDELEWIRSSNQGQLHPEHVVKKAANLLSPIHQAFNWDDEKAAHEYRLWQARQLIRSVCIVQKEGEEPIPAFWNVTVRSSPDEKPERYYQSSIVIAKSPEEYASALRLMQSELANAEKGLQRLYSLAPKGERMKVRRAAKSVAEAHKAISA